MMADCDEGSEVDKLTTVTNLLERIAPESFDFSKAWAFGLEMSDLHISQAPVMGLDEVCRDFLGTHPSVWSRVKNGIEIIKIVFLGGENDVVENLLRVRDLFSSCLENEINFNSSQKLFMVTCFLTCLEIDANEVHMEAFILNLLCRVNEGSPTSMCDPIKAVIGRLSMEIVIAILQKSLQSTFFRLSVLRIQMEVVDRLLEYQLICSGQSCTDVTKRIIGPLLKLISSPSSSSSMSPRSNSFANDATLSKICSHCNALFRTRADPANAMTLICTILTHPALEALPTLSKDEAFWEVTQLCLLDTDMTTRKRAAFVLQSLPTPGHPPDKSVLPLEGFKGKRCWWTDFLDAYTQVEGCTSMHLVNQAWPLLDHLGAVAAANPVEGPLDLQVVQLPPPANRTQSHQQQQRQRKPTASTTSFPPDQIGEEGVTLGALVSSTANSVRASGDPEAEMGGKGSTLCLPRVTFSWVKALLHCGLRAQIPTIRRAFLHRLLGGGFPLRVCAATIKWLCSEVLPNIVDSVTFFSVHFVNPSVDIGCKDAIDEVHARHEKHQQGQGLQGAGLKNRINGNLPSKLIGGAQLLLGPFTSAIISVAPGSSGGGAGAGAGAAAGSGAEHRNNSPNSNGLNSVVNPGVLMPSFIARLLASCLAIDSERSRPDLVLDEEGVEVPSLVLSSLLVRSLVDVVCREDGLHSLSAIKWIVRAFADPHVVLLLPRCLGIDDLTLIRRFADGRLACSNGQVRVQIHQGLVPLVLGAAAVSSSLSSKTARKLSLLSSEAADDDLEASASDLNCMFAAMGLLVCSVGLNEVVANPSNHKRLQTMVIEALTTFKCNAPFLISHAAFCRGQSQTGTAQAPSVLPPAQQHSRSHLLAIASAFLDERTAIVTPGGSGGRSDENAARLDWLRSFQDQEVSTLGKLFTSPYVDRVVSDRSLWFLCGTIQCARLAATMLGRRRRNGAKDDDSTSRAERDDPRAVSHVPSVPRLEEVEATVADVGSYLAQQIKGMLCAAYPSLRTTYSTSSQQGSDKLAQLELFVEAFGGLLTLGPLLAAKSTSSFSHNSAIRSRCAACIGVIIATLDVFTSLLDAAINSIVQREVNGDPIHMTLTAYRDDAVALSSVRVSLPVNLSSAVQAVAPALVATCASVVLRGLRAAWPHCAPVVGGDADLHDAFLSAVQRLGSALLESPCPDAKSFGFLKDIISGSSSDTEGGGEMELEIQHRSSSSNSSSVGGGTEPVGGKKAPSSHEATAFAATALGEFVKKCDQFGRCSAEFLESRWSAINMCLKLSALGDLVHSHSNLRSEPVQSPMNSHSRSLLDAVGGNGVEEGAARRCAELLEVAIEQFDICSPPALPDLLECCIVGIRGLAKVVELERSSPHDGAADAISKRSDFVATVEKVLAGAWMAGLGSSVCLDLKAVAAFVRLAFDAAVIRLMPAETIKHYYGEVVALAQTRPHVMVCLVAQLVGVWMADPLLSIDFFSEIKDLLLYKEAKLDDNNTADPMDDIVDDADNMYETQIHKIENKKNCRIMVLLFIESLALNGRSIADASTQPTSAPPVMAEVTLAIQNLSKDLMSMNLRPEFVASAMIGTELFGAKLRCWQALCVLVPSLTADMLDGLVPTFVASLSHSCAPGIRVHMEIWGAAVTARFPARMVPVLLEQLAMFDHSQQKLSTLFVILGHLVVEKDHALASACGVDGEVGSVVNGVDESGESTAPGAATTTVPALRNALSFEALVDHLLPWMACATSLTRAIAQLLMYFLIPKVVNVEDIITRTSSPLGNALAQEGSGVKYAHLRSIFAYLVTNKESKKIIVRQQQFFTEYSLASRCEVNGLLALGYDAVGEIVPVHILSVLTETVKAMAEAEAQAALADSMDAAVVLDQPSQRASTGQGASDRAGVEGERDESDDTSSSPLLLQTKRIPFDDLQLSLDEEVLSRTRNEAGRRRQELVVCASLIDKATNLAGIARTCEIFAVEELVVPSLAVVRTDTFQGIAVSCEAWLAMSEVPPEKLMTYLQSMRERGYTIVGLEQTGSSLSLATVQMPRRCVLLLGKEKEGVPAELLQELDLCIEIPQFGVTRSLNVHVSAALTIWEMTKQNTDFMEG